MSRISPAVTDVERTYVLLLPLLVSEVLLFMVELKVIVTE